MSWKDPERWVKMLSGESCPFCADIHLEENRFSFLVSDLKYSYVRLPKNQYWRGWTIVALKRHANELFELSPEELFGFWSEVARVSKAVQEVFHPIKINYAIYGNLCPHVHCHVFPQQFENDPHARIKQDAEEMLLSTDEYHKIIGDLRDAINPHIILV